MTSCGAPGDWIDCPDGNTKTHYHAEEHWDGSAYGGNDRSISFLADGSAYGGNDRLISFLADGAGLQSMDSATSTDSEYVSELESWNSSTLTTDEEDCLWLPECAPSTTQGKGSVDHVVPFEALAVEPSKFATSNYHGHHEYASKPAHRPRDRKSVV